jgi:methyl-accepting chemotaxis protein
MFLALNYAIVRYCSNQPLLRQQHDRELMTAVLAALNDQSQALLDLRQEIDQLRVTSANQRTMIQSMKKTLDTAGGKLAKLSGDLDKLRFSNDEVVRVADSEEKALFKIAKSLADIKAQLQEVRESMARSGFKP